MKSLIRTSLAIALGVLAISAASAQEDYPSRPITLVIPYAAGGPTDVYGRLFAEKLAETLGQNIVVENKPGAATQIGAAAVAVAPNDGYTLLIANTTTLSLNPKLYEDLSYKVSDFAPIALVSKIPIGFAVRADLPAKDVAEFRTFAAQSDPELAFGSAGIGSNSAMVNLLMNQTLGVTMVEVPYKGTAPALVDLAAGQVDGLVDAMATLAPMHKDGKIRIIGNFDTERSSAVPDVPTFREQGVDLDAFTWNALVAPAGTPAPVIEKLAAAAKTIADDPAFKERLVNVGFSTLSSTPQELTAYIGTEADRWQKLIETMDIKLDR